MAQTLLLPDCDAQDRWQPAVPPFRPRPLAGVSRRKPLPEQLFLPGIVPTDEGGSVLRLPGEDDQALCQGPSDGVPASKPICPNCGGVEFDEDGDCTACWEPEVVVPAGGRRRIRRTGWPWEGAK
jgi:hypothetical protein